MASDTIYVVYWLRNAQCVCPWKHGYVGITNNFVKRLYGHRKRFPLGFEASIIFTGTRKECREIEYKLRPKNRIGWNIAPGGARPLNGRVLSEATRSKISAAQKGKHCPWKSRPSPMKGKSTGRPSPIKGRPSPLKGIPTGRSPTNKGKKATAEVLANQSAAQKGRPSPKKGMPSPLKGRPTGKKGVPNGRKGIPSPLKGKTNLLNKGRPAYNKGKPSPLKGRPMSEEAKEKMHKPKSEAHKENLRKPKSEEAKANMRIAARLRWDKKRAAAAAATSPPAS